MNIPVETIFEYYDMPLLFIGNHECVDYLCVLDEESEYDYDIMREVSPNVFFCAEVSADTTRQLLDKTLSFRQVFLNTPRYVLWHDNALTLTPTTLADHLESIPDEGEYV